MNQPTEPSVLTESERLTLVIEIWKKTVEVQQHFNDIELRIRNIAITVLGAALGATAFSMKEGLTITLFGLEILAGKLIIAAALFAWLAFYFMDRFWYHRLLMGAVNLGIKIEGLNKGLLPEIDLSSEIKKTSPVKVFGTTLHSNQKMDLFYLSFAAVLLAAVFVLGGPPNEVPMSQPSGGVSEEPVSTSAPAEILNDPPSAGEQPCLPENTEQSVEDKDSPSQNEVTDDIGTGES